MLATMNISQSTASIHQNNQLDLARGEHVDLDKICPGCTLTAVTDDGGLVVAFGQSFFHVDCFKCAKCGNKVTADTNLLLLSDGSPVCASCSYNCNVCQLPILDEAIMTGDDSYHAHCFKCKVCRNRIDELVFAKTSQGIYCMDCHNERMIKIRKHAQRKAEREKAGGSASSRDGKYKRENGQPSPALNPYDTPLSSKTYHASTPNEQTTPRNKVPPSRRRSGPYVDDAFSPTTQRTKAPAKSSPSYLTPMFPQPPQHQQPLSVTVAPPVDNATPSRPSLHHQSSTSSEQFIHQEGRANGSLDVATSARDKRRSINPSLTLNNLQAPASPPAAASPSLSPIAASFMQQQGSRSATPPRQNGTDSSYVASPRREHFAESRPLSNGSVYSDGSRTRDLASEDDRANGRGSPRRQATGDEQGTLLQPSSSADDTTPRSRKLSSPRDTPTSNGRTSPDTVRPRRSFDERPPTKERPPTREKRPSTANGAISPKDASRAPSRAAVPHSVESTDTEGEHDYHRHSESQDSIPPVPPPKREHERSPDGLSPHGEYDADSSNVSQQDSGSDDMSESSPVEQTSHSTFIAPALPPIRFSMNTADFSDLLNSVGGINSLKSLDQLAHREEGSDDDVPPTPPPTASSLQANGVSSTPDSDRTAFPSPEADSSKGRGSSEQRRDERPSTPTSVPPIQVTSENQGETQFTLSPPDSSSSSSFSRPEKENSDFVFVRLQEALTDARDRGAQQLKMDRAFVEAILNSMQARKTDLLELKGRFDGMKRASKQYIEGLTVAQTEYDRELKARRDAEAEVTRLRVLLSGQAARLTTLSGDSRKQELRQQMTKDLSDKLSGLEQDLSKLTVDRDMALAEVEELSAAKSSNVEQRPALLNRSLTMRLDNLKSQYQKELAPLSKEREVLAREIAELKAVRDVFLEETTVLNARNEELAQLSAQYARRMDNLPETPLKKNIASQPSEERMRPQAPQMPLQQNLYTSTTSLATDDSMTLNELRPKFSKSDIELPTPSKGKFIKWPGSRAKDPISSPSMDRSKSQTEHNFQQLSVLRFTRCDHCGDKMWGSQLRCNGCNISVHVRCINQVQVVCSHQASARDDSQPMPPSMFGRDLVEQVHADAQLEGGSRLVPVIVEKCIDAVESIALEYEGIYRKTGGSGQSKIITQLFERGDYNAFDLRDFDRFNDICSVTSVLKTYFRSLPVPLFTYDLHDHFMAAVENRDKASKDRNLTELINKLPPEHYATVRELMLHLNRIMQRSERNLMNARNLGVVFGPTLMRSRNPGAEFSDMAGKALSIEWIVENAVEVFGNGQQ